ncbi:hypothetical protein DMA12_34800 [Amycolatopsis balhimycina DSM 5908]|uniref:Peptidase inhibitor n=1 Tax=Amycolatopsis balhimycina DSM 5908 TaxID=1081091 RepID=A0A428W4B2_AMYBA|nr:hypothetical protein [Amycolatopsis balhimycina]RSM37928.1 hypothetical protein DMA12_34800 [Amycolatopsis balhimycina DSM 5908]
MKRALTAAAALTLGAAAVTVAGAPPATATCALSYYCGYQGVDYGPKECAWAGSDSNYNTPRSCLQLNGIRNGSANDMISSYQNWGTGTYNCLRSFKYANYSYETWFTPSEFVYPGNGKVSWVGTVDNDEASSHYWQSC